MSMPGDVYDYFMTLDESEMRWVREWLDETPSARIKEEIEEAIEQGEAEREG